MNLVKPCFSNLSNPVPCRVEVMMDFHAHLDRHEVIQTLLINPVKPCFSTLSNPVYAGLR
jgi:hypothetical protein